MFKRKKKKTGTQIPPQYNPPPMPPVKPPNPPTSGSNAVGPGCNCGHQPSYTSTQNPPDVFSSIIKSSPVAVLPNDIGSIEIMCQYETPCGWCTKWDKKCDKKIPERGLRAKCNFIEDAIDSSDAMNVIDQAIDELKLLENVIEATKHPDIDYARFRKSVCAYCHDPNCMKSQVEICDCHKFEGYY